LLPKQVVEADINQAFFPVQGAAVAAVCVYMLFLFYTSKRWMSEDESGWQKGAGQLLGIAYGVAFMAVAALVILSLTNIYQSGIRAKIRALATSLEYRLDSAFALGLTLDDFTGLEAVFNEYRELNPDLSYVAMTRGGQTIFHTDPNLVGTVWQEHGDTFEEDVPLAQGDEASALSLHLGIPKSVVYNRLWRSAKNFLALFVASAFLAQLFFSLIRSLSNRPTLTPGKLHAHRGFLLSLIGPLYFVSIFTIHGLATAFLPQYFKTLAAEGNIAIDVSTLFSTYYITYTIALFATSKPADKYGPKPFLVLGAGLIVLELLLLSFVRNFYLMFLVQIVTGLGEGMLFNAVFTYIITVASKQQRTRGAGIIVSSLYGGWLSGTAIGALLAADPTIGLLGVFLIGAIIAVLIFLYAYFAIPSFRGENFGEHELAADDRDPTSMAIETVTQAAMRQEVAREAERKRVAAAPFFERLRYRLRQALGDFEFFKTALLIGVPVKIIVAGFFKASLPLMLAQQNYATEDVGQIMMLYFGGVLVSSAIITRLADKLGNTRLILLIGGIGSGLGLILMGLVGWDVLANSSLAA
jgi:MFS family permease